MEQHKRLSRGNFMWDRLQASVVTYYIEHPTAAVRLWDKLLEVLRELRP